MMLYILGQREGLHGQVNQVSPIFEQEKQQVKHDPETNGKAESTLADHEYATGQVLPAFQRRAREFLLNFCRAVQIVLSQEMAHPHRRCCMTSASIAGSCVSWLCNLL